MIKVVIFDFAGVLANEGYWGWLKKIVPNVETKRKLFQDLADKADRGDFSKEEYSKILAEKTGRPLENIPKEILDGYICNSQMVSLLVALKKQMPLGLLSNFPSDWLRPLLEKYNLLQYFTHIVISSEIHMIKPHKEIFLHTISLFNVQPEEAVFIDDREVNVAGAKSAGLHGIVFTSVEQLKKDLAKLGVTAN